MKYSNLVLQKRQILDIPNFVTETSIPHFLLEGYYAFKLSEQLLLASTRLRVQELEDRERETTRH
jgi:hypothetical protein